MEIILQIFVYIFNAGVGFIVGFLVALWLISQKYKLVRINKNDPAHNTDDVVVNDMNAENNYYVRLPNEDVKTILVEEPLAVGHIVRLEGIKYVVDSVVHETNSHTIFNLLFR